jgi:HEAT repeat protein/outer membrane protein assembly factor BamE (lipoprotein component of BamABCDE complex)
MICVHLCLSVAKFFFLLRREDRMSRNHANLLFVFALCILSWSATAFSAAKPAAPAGKAPALTPADEKLTSENYDKIKPGMTKDEVEEILGKSKSGGHDSSGNAFADWPLKTDRKHKITVNYKNGVVVSKSTTIDFAAIAAADTAAKNKAAADANRAAMTTAASALAANYAKLKPGMTEQQVQDILGATGVQFVKASAGRSALVWEYPDGRFAYVIFQDGKATSMDCSEVPPADHHLSIGLLRRIHLGMDLATVQKLMGSDGEATPINNGVRHKWKEGREDIVVITQNDKVSQIFGTMEKKPLVSFEKTADDKLAEAIALLTSATDKKEIKKGLDILNRTPIDPARKVEVSKLIDRHMKDKDSAVVEAAHKALQRWATKENVPTLLAMLSRPLSKDPTDKNRENMPLAIEVLGNLQEPQAVPHLVNKLKDFFSKDDVSLALKKIGPAAAEPELRKLASQHKDAVRDRAEQILAEFKDGGPFLPSTIKHLKDPSQDLRGVAADEISKMYVHPARRAEVTRALLPVVADPHWVAALHACNAMARWGTAENEPALIAALGNANADVRAAAAHALQNWGTAKSLPALEPLTQDKDGKVALAAGDAIAVIKAR